MAKKVALITGGSKGIGRGIAKAFSKNNYDVIITARNASVLEQTAKDIERDTGGNIIPVAMDMCDALSVAKLAEIINDKFGKLDVLIGNAAIVGVDNAIDTIDADHFAHVFNINVFANQLLISHLHPLLMQAEYPRAVFVTTSPASLDGRPNYGLYGASKSALGTMIRSYARFHQDTKLRVNLVDPGRVRTDMRATVAPDEDPMILPTPDEIAPFFVDLCSKDCQQTGETFTVAKN